MDERSPLENYGELPVRQPGATLHESTPTPLPVFTPHSDIDTPAGAPGYENAPKHYRGASGIQSFDVWDAYCMDPYRATAWKYFSRFDKKGSQIHDLQKLVHYIDESIARLPESTDDFLSENDISLSPEVIIQAFGLTGLMADAALDFLLSFTVRRPRTNLRSAKSLVEEYLFTLQ